MAKIVISDVKLEAIENGLLLSWCEELQNEEGSYNTIPYERKKKSFTMDQQMEAVSELMTKSKMNEMSHKGMVKDGY